MVLGLCNPSPDYPAFGFAVIIHTAIGFQCWASATLLHTALAFHSAVIRTALGFHSVVLVLPFSTLL